MSAVLPEPRTAEITDIARAAVRAAIRAVEQHGACAVCQERLARLHEQYPWHTTTNAAESAAGSA